MNPLEGKYTNWYFNIVNECKVSPPQNVYTERHHIVPECLGGSDDDSNMVALTAKQHFICHLLLTKMFKPKTFEYYKMIHAFCMMDWCHGKDGMPRYTSRVHEKQRREFSEYMSLKQTGEGNNQFGTRWAYNEELRECKKIPKGNDAPEGWVWGRVLNWDKHFEKPKDITYECLGCGELISGKYGRMYCSSKCRYNTLKPEPIYNKDSTKKVSTKKVSTKKVRAKRVFISTCKECSMEFRGNSSRKKFCSSKCCNVYQFKHPKMISLYKGDEVKEVKAQNAPAYKKYGWYTRRDSNARQLD